MAISRNPKSNSHIGAPTLLLGVIVAATTFLFLFSAISSTLGFSFSSSNLVGSVIRSKEHGKYEKFLYWGYRIDCPGKHCDTCAGLGHQESSLRCALEEAMFLKRTFVMPSRMCINPMHNKKGIFLQSSNTSTEENWIATTCAMDSLYDMELMSQTIPVIQDNSKMWHHVLSASIELGARGIANVSGVGRTVLKEDSHYANVLLINRTASPLAWFAECKDRENHSAIMLPYSFLPSMATKKLRDAAYKIKQSLGDYDALHVRRGDILKTRKDRFGVERSLHPHVARDTRPEYILPRIAKWIPAGRTIFIGTNEKIPGFFSPLGVRYKLAYSSNFSAILDPIVENNYQLFMIERLIMDGAKTFINTFKSDDSELSLTDDVKKNTKVWYKVLPDEEGS